MTYNQYRMGEVVYDPNDVLFKPKRLGHIVGFDYDNSSREVILVVRWCDGVEETVHPEVVGLYE